MNTPDRPPVEHDAINRRTIMQGAAWTVPIIATASAAPLAAASADCPNVQDTSLWRYRHVYGSFFQGTNSFIETGSGFPPSPGPGWYSIADTAPPPGRRSEYFVETDIPVVAGRTYTMDVGILANRYDTAAGGSFSQILDIYMGGELLYNGATGYNIPNDNAEHLQRLSFTATTTGTVSFQFRFTQDAPAFTDRNHDNIRVRFPEFIC